MTWQLSKQSGSMFLDMMLMGEWAMGLTVSVTVGDFPTFSLCKFMQTIKIMFRATTYLKALVYSLYNWIWCVLKLC